MPHILVGIGATGFWIFLWLWLLFGTNLNGFVTGTDTSYSSKSGRSYSAKFSYVVGGETRMGSGSINRADYERFRAQGDDPRPEVVVRYFSLGPFRHADLRTNNSHGWGAPGFLTLWVAFWDTIVGMFVYTLWIKPLRVRWLYKYGEATWGTTMGKHVQRGKSTTYYIDYAFNDPATGREFKAETQVGKREGWEQAQTGQQVIVLYAPTNPKRSTVYEFGGYQVELENGDRVWT